jgi:hypothetical protein
LVIAPVGFSYYRDYLYGNKAGAGEFNSAKMLASQDDQEPAAAKYSSGLA